MTTYRDGHLIVPKGTVIEWDTQTVAPHATIGRVVQPKCANSGSLERAGDCSCAPDPNSPEVIAFREHQALLEEAQARFNKPKRMVQVTPSPLVAPGFTKLAPLNLAVPKPEPVVKSKTSKKPKAKQKQIKKQTRGRR